MPASRSMAVAAGRLTRRKSIWRASRARLSARWVSRSPELFVADVALVDGRPGIRFPLFGHAGDQRRTNQLCYRYLTLLDGLRIISAEPLPGPPPRWEEISGRYTP